MKNSQGQEIIVDAQGYLLSFADWDSLAAEQIASSLGITLTDKHWQVISYLQDKHRQGKDMTIRKMGDSGVVTIKELYDLFPSGPLKYSSKIAGLPRPKNCV